jgi:hypothetical protein
VREEKSPAPAGVESVTRNAGGTVKSNKSSERMWALLWSG